MYVSKTKIPLTVILVETCDVPEIRKNKLNFALQTVKCRKEPGQDGIVTDLLSDTEKLNKRSV